MRLLSREEKVEEFVMARMAGVSFKSSLKKHRAETPGKRNKERRGEGKVRGEREFLFQLWHPSGGSLAIGVFGGAFLDFIPFINVDKA